MGGLALDGMFEIKSYGKAPTFSRLGKTLLYTAAFNTIIAVLLVIVGFGRPFLHTLLYSQCIGLTICMCVVFSLYAARNRGMILRGIAVVMALTIGAVVGTSIAAAFIQLPGDPLNTKSMYLWQILGISILFGMIITYFFHSKEKLSATTQLAQEERIKRLSSEKLALEADLKRLQAQVEPHFLFNTLSNIVSLMDSDPVKAKSMQLDLIRYLRTTLGRSRNQETTLGQEAELMRAYLNIFKIRMGERLEFNIDIPDKLKVLQLSPMLLQPIVENAVLHGLEPKIDGGRIRIRAKEEEGIVNIEVSDSGCGMVEHQQPGVGLTNVRKRLEQLYGNQGRLVIKENQPYGLTVVVEVPIRDEIEHKVVPT